MKTATALLVVLALSGCYRSHEEVMGEIRVASRLEAQQKCLAESAPMGVPAQFSAETLARCVH